MFIYEEVADYSWYSENDASYDDLHGGEYPCLTKSIMSNSSRHRNDRDDCTSCSVIDHLVLILWPEVILLVNSFETETWKVICDIILGHTYAFVACVPRSNTLQLHRPGRAFWPAIIVFPQSYSLYDTSREVLGTGPFFVHNATSSRTTPDASIETNWYQYIYSIHTIIGICRSSFAPSSVDEYRFE